MDAVKKCETRRLVVLRQVRSLELNSTYLSVIPALCLFYKNRDI